MISCRDIAWKRHIDRTATRRALAAMHAFKEMQDQISFEAISDWIVDHPIVIYDDIVSRWRDVNARHHRPRSEFRVTHLELIDMKFHEVVHSWHGLISIETNWSSLPLSRFTLPGIKIIRKRDPNHQGTLRLLDGPFTRDDLHSVSLHMHDFQRLYVTEKLFGRAI